MLISQNATLCVANSLNLVFEPQKPASWIAGNPELHQSSEEVTQNSKSSNCLQSSESWILDSYNYVWFYFFSNTISRKISKLMIEW